jgi:hypothetical protein
MDSLEEKEGIMMAMHLMGLNSSHVTVPIDILSDPVGFPVFGEHYYERASIQKTMQLALRLSTFKSIDF